MCDCVHDGVCKIVAICSLQYLCVMTVCILETVFEESFFLSEFRTDVRTIFLGGTIQETGAERERERESRMGQSRRPTRTRLMMTVRKNQMVLKNQMLQRHNQVNVCI